MTTSPPYTKPLKHRIDTKKFKDILFDYQRYNNFDVHLFNQQGRLNKQVNIFPLDERLFNDSVINNINYFDQTLNTMNKQRAILFPLFERRSPLTNEYLTFQLNVLLVPLLAISNRIIAYYKQNSAPGINKERHRLASELHSIVNFLQAMHHDMNRYRELSLLEWSMAEEIKLSRGYLALHDTIVGQTRMELEAEQQDFHDIYLHDRLLSYRDRTLGKSLDKLRAEREKQKALIDKALHEFERQYQAEIRNRIKVIDTLNNYLGDTFLNEIHPGQGYEVLPSGRRRNTEFSKYLNALLPLYNSLRKLTIENHIFYTLQMYARRHNLMNQHN